MADAITTEVLHEGIKQALKEAFPDLETVDDYPTEKGKIKTPAAFLNMAAIEPGDSGGDDGTERLDSVLRWEISIIMGKVPTKEVKRQTRMRAADVALWVHGNRFDLRVRPAEFIRAEADDFSPELSRYAPWLIEFEQSVPLGASVWDGTAVVPTEVYVGQEPDTGPEHEADYVKVTDE